MRRLSITLSLVALLQNLPAIAQTQVPETTSQTSSDSIQQVIAAKWMTNFADGNFYPERLLSRAELATIMVKAFRLDKRQGANKENLVIPDVPRSYWAFNDIQTVLKTDIMKGYRGNQFFPNQKVTKAEALAIFAQAYGVFQFSDDVVNEILAVYPDEKSIPSWARKAIATVATEGFLNTDAQNNISPLQPVTRGDIAYVLSKYLQRQKQQPETPEVPIIPNSEPSP
ncbi:MULTISPECIES: S-layer homology domain-containing protein [Nostoc]|uniref:S-layer homology domain-containing protein n=1 Tax=Nostoc punctiforme FACHB-252 TaxID=1357509 RepID=A0ABR8HD24_NOSPU|nr:MULTISPECIES: S-layer homology domain-containing protein [Nostoc]MBC1239720.1 S-layer homology domain-containing protein [Nostoc sp. 2RC]MBD2613654.1 S-layer homology domain-containing protein [Nostoc punctiforme FACHB-252]MBL1202851.1 S-layer homology domain-containing protein [Nostoc sp. GBBB01]